MNSTKRTGILAWFCLCAMVIGPAERTLADVAPPVSIRLVTNGHIATAGEPFDGTFEIRAYQPGELSGFQIEGEGWHVVSSTLPSGVQRVSAGSIQVTITATPTDPDKPLALSLRYNGRLVRTVFEVGSSHAARMAQPRLLTRIADSTGLRPTAEKPAKIESTTPPTARGEVFPIRVVGRVVYDRPGIDRSDPEDGDFDDPGDVPPATIGGDSMRVILYDKDTFNSETIWTGSTDEEGYFDSGVVMWDDCEVIALPPFYDCDVPDLVLKVGAALSDVVAVVNTDLEIYTFIIPEMENFAGDFFDYGTIKPSAGEMPAIHIHNNVVRATRFVMAEGASQQGLVAVIWPDDSQGDRAWYVPGEDAIHISTDRQWQTDTIIHEFGHHHMDQFYDPVPTPDYCDADADCDPNPPTTCGHCMWCGENEAVAWFEGMPNWIADMVTRDYPDRYTFDDGSPFIPLYTRPQESPRTCEGFYNNPETTEGFVGALLRDIEDATQDDHDDDADPDVASRDGVFDLMCLGTSEIFTVMESRLPGTVTEFIADFLDLFPQHTDDLWATAFNVGGSAYVASFPADAQLPGEVANVNSKTHPLGVGGSLPCINFDFDPASDDATGANVYSYTISTDPAGLEPDTGADPVVGTDECQIRGSMIASDLGDYYIGIKAQDNDGNWSSDWHLEGAFEVIDCNNNGILDVCDVTCDGGELDMRGLCLTALPSGMCDREGCGQSPDCNGNIIPDSCDIVNGTSEDCDLNGVPDECQAIKHWTSELDPPEGYDWGLDGNWAEGQRPVLNDVACIPADSYGATVVFTEADAPLTSLACGLNFIIDGPSTAWPEHLELMENSFVLGSLQMEGNSTLTVHDRIYVDEKFHWMGGTVDGTGVTEVTDGVRLTQSSVNLVRGELKLLSGDSFSNGPRISLSSGADVTIRTSATYSYEGNSYLFYGSSGLITLDGTIIRTAGDNTALINTPMDNKGTLRTMTGELVVGSGGTHTGAFIGDPGTRLTLATNIGNNTHEFLGASSLQVDTLELGNGTGNFHGTVDITNWLYGTGGTWTFFDDANVISYGQNVNVERGKVVFEGPTDRPTEFQTVTITTPGESSGRIDFNSGQPVNVGTFSMLTGSLYGPSPINVSDEFIWTNGIIFGGGAITVDGQVRFNATSSSRSILRVLNVTNQANVFSGFSMSGGGRVNNLDGAVFNMQFNNGNIGGGTFNNFGTILRTSGDGVAGIGSAMNNSGLIHNQSGTFALTGSGTHTGDLLSDPGTVLKIGGSNQNFEPSSTITTPNLELIGFSSSTHGTVNVSDTLTCDNCSWAFENDADIIDYGDHLIMTRGSLHVDSPTDRAVDFDTVDIQTNFNGYSLYFNTGQPININTFTMANNGSIYGSSPINIATQFTWTNGSIQSGGRIRCDGNTTVNATSSQRDLRRPLDNYGTMTVKGGFGSNASGPITNKPGAVMDLQYQNSSIGLSGTIHNEGAMLKTTSAGAAGLPNVVNTGIIDIQMGSLQFHTSYVDFVQTAGETILNDTNIEMFLDVRPIHLEGGVLKGNGSIIGDIDNSGGTVSPGFSAGEIQVDDYTQGPNGVLDIEIAGRNPGEFDVLAVAGTANLAGELTVTDINGFVAGGGDTFTILTAAQVLGTFDTLTIPAHYEVVVSATGVTLQSTLPSPDLNADGLINLGDFQLLQVCFQGPGEPPSSACPDDIQADLDVDGDVDLDDYQILFAAALSD